MEWLVLGVFCGGLLLCLLLDVSILYALLAGLLLFFAPLFSLLRKRKKRQEKYYLPNTSATASTSTSTPLGRVFTATQERAGQSPVKNRA